MGLFGGDGGAKSASKLLIQGADEARGYQDDSLNKTITALDPYTRAGSSALQDLLMRLGLSGDTTNANYGDLTKSYTAQDFQTDPGYQFRVDQGQQAIDRHMAAGGKYFTPEAMKATADYNQDIASDEFNNAWTRNNVTQGNIFDRLNSINNQGFSATGAKTGAWSNWANNAVTDIYVTLTKRA